MSYADLQDRYSDVTDIKKKKILKWFGHVVSNVNGTCVNQ